MYRGIGDEEEEADADDADADIVDSVDVLKSGAG